MISAGAFAQAAHAGEFSADIVSRDAAGTAIGAVAKLYVRNHMVRIETPEAPAGFLLINGDAGTAQFVRPAQQLFMANRFAIPPGFRNFDPRALIERIKHSDAWVDP